MNMSRNSSSSNSSSSNSNTSSVRRSGYKPRDADINLICLPPAGAGASTFYPLLELDSNKLQICPIALPGREDRFAEAIPQSINALAQQMAVELLPILDRPYAILGYSMGALLGRELVHHWQKMNLSSPVMMISLSARAPQRRYGNDQLLHKLPSNAFQVAISELGGMPEELLKLPGIMEIYEPILRADMRNCETYEYASLPIMNTELHVIHGKDDTLVSRQDAEAWNQHTSGNFTLHSINAPHILPQKILIDTVRQITSLITIR